MSSAQPGRVEATADSDAQTSARVEPFLRLDTLSKAYAGGVLAVDKLGLDIEQGELVALLGPSGCGKTTTLRMIAGLVAPSAGRIVMDGDDITALPPYRRDIGMVFQNYALFPHLSVARNVAFGLEMRSVPRDALRERVREALAMVRLTGYEDRRPRALSGGQQQRVALARALVVRPKLLLLDEPLSNLDAKLREEMRNEIRNIQRSLQITTVFVTHDQVEALSMCDRIALMDRGRLEQLDSPVRIYERPRTPFVARFVGRINRLDAEVDADGSVRLAAGPVLPGVDPGTVRGAAVAMVRPHLVRVGTAQAPLSTTSWPGLPGQIGALTYIGDLVQIEVSGAGYSLVAEYGTGDPLWRSLAEGMDVTVSWPLPDTQLFDRAEDPERGDG